MNPFATFDDVPVPDQWDDITHRARTTGPVSRSATDGHPRRRLVLAGAAILAIAVIATLTVRDDGGTTVRANEPPTLSEPHPTSPTSVVVPPNAPVAVLCPDGGLTSTTIPSDASSEPTLPDDVTGQRHVRSWTSDGLRYELLVPGLDYIDFDGERTEQVQEPPGLLFYQSEETRFLGTTDLAGPCNSYELAVAGGTEEQRVSALLQVVAGFAFEPSLGTTDCGDLTSAALHVTSGANAMAAVRDLDAADVMVAPRSAGDPVPQVETRSDGRCEMTVATQGGLRPIATISGRDGRYGLDALRGFAPRGFDGASGTVQMDVSASVQVQGQQFSVDVDYWCDDCAQATITLHYPDDGLTARASTSGPGPFTGNLDRPSTPGSFGWIAIVWSSASGEGRGIWTTNVSSGDFAAG